MSLLANLLRKRKELKPSETLVTTADGCVFTERFAADGSIIVTNPAKAVPGGYGYVVDTKPDIDVAWVLPGLAVGSQDVAQDMELLKNNSFTHVLSIGIDVPELYNNPRFHYRFVELLDLPESKLSDVLPVCFQFIDEGRASGHIYVHCNAGVSRSASIVLAYLMRDGKTFCDAYSHLKSVRSCVRPNDGFIKQLKQLEQQFISNGKVV